MKQFAHKALLLSTIIFLITLALPVTALADGGGGENEFTQTVNGYQVVLVFEKPATVGDNQIHVQVNDEQNMPVSDANVGVSVVKSDAEHNQAEAHTNTDSQMADMPGMVHDPEPPSSGQSEMASMPGMDMSGASSEAPSTAHDKMVMTSLKAGHESGEYAGEIAIESPGHCIVRVHLTVQGKLTEVDFPLNIVQPQNGTGILLSFFAVNVVIIAAAVVLKPKPVPAILLKGA